MWNGTLAELAGFTESPTSDGILGDWVRKRATAPFTAADLPALVALLRAPDPHLQEAGIELATAALPTLDAAAELEPQLVALATLDSDPYVLEALVDLLEHHELAGLFGALARLEPHAPASRFAPPLAGAPPPWSHPPPPRPRVRFILRNRLAEPWPRFRALAATRVR
jgi:hypothetical protein